MPDAKKKPALPAFFMPLCKWQRHTVLRSRRLVALLWLRLKRAQLGAAHVAEAAGEVVAVGELWHPQALLNKGHSGNEILGVQAG